MIKTKKSCKPTPKTFKVTFANGGSILTEDHGILWALTRMVEANREVAKIEEIER